MTHTEQLIQAVTKYGTTTEGTEATKDGQKYRYDRTELNSKFTPNWLVNLWIKAAEENGKRYGTNFISGDYSFHFARAAFKGQPNGKITFSKLIKL